MKKVFVSGCYDILHAGHIQFFEEAKALGDYLSVSFASEDVLWHHKKRRSSIPDEHKRVLLESLRIVDEVVVGHDLATGLDFESDFRRIRPDFLAVTEDDLYTEVKKALCEEVGAKYVVLKKTPPRFPPVSTSSIVRWVQAPSQAPLRVDFAGGWLDVPAHSRPGTFIVNCSISPLVSLREWPYARNAGLGGSGAWALLNGKDGVESELNLGVGWQDPAVIRESGVCVWKSGKLPALDFKRNGEFLQGKMALFWTGNSHDTPGIRVRERNYDLIAKAGNSARQGVLEADVARLAEGVQLSYQAQLDEGMNTLPEFPNSIAKKYCGGGWGGYVLYLFDSEENRATALSSNALLAIEPYIH